MSKAGKQIIAAAEEAVAVAKGELPAARIWQQGHAYVPEVKPPADIKALCERLETRARTMNGASVGDGDSDTHTIGYYSVADRKLDREASQAITTATSRADEAEKERDEARAHEQAALAGLEQEGKNHWAQRDRAEASEAEVKRLREALETRSIDLRTVRTWIETIAHSAGCSAHRCICGKDRMIEILSYLGDDHE